MFAFTSWRLKLQHYPKESLKAKASNSSRRNGRQTSSNNKLDSVLKASVIFATSTGIKHEIAERNNVNSSKTKPTADVKAMAEGLLALAVAVRVLAKEEVTQVTQAKAKAKARVEKQLTR